MSAFAWSSPSSRGPIVMQSSEGNRKLGKVGSPTITRHTAAEKQIRHKALIRFQCHEEACRAVRERQGGHLLNLPITLRVLP